MYPTLSYPGQFWCNNCEEYNCDHVESHIRYWNEYYHDDGSNRNHYLHNENGPAYISDSGNKFYYIEDQLHRIDQPAIEYADGGYKFYYKGVLHRDNGPAVVMKNYNGSDTELYYHYGVLHNDKGPAEKSGNCEIYYLYGKRYKEEDWLEQVTKP